MTPGLTCSGAEAELEPSFFQVSSHLPGAGGTGVLAFQVAKLRLCQNVPCRGHTARARTPAWALQNLLAEGWNPLRVMPALPLSRAKFRTVLVGWMGLTPISPRKKLRLLTERETCPRSHRQEVWTEGMVPQRPRGDLSSPSHPQVAAHLEAKV